MDAGACTAHLGAVPPGGLLDPEAEVEDPVGRNGLEDG